MRRRNSVDLIMSVLIFAGLLFARQLPARPAMDGPNGTVGGPIMGYLFDSAAGGVRQLRGIPGASLLGGALDPGVKLHTAVSAPDSEFLLGIAGENFLPLLLTVSDGSVLARSVDGASAGVDGIALSPGGSAAALLSSRGGWIEVIAGLPGAPRLLRRLPAPGTTMSLLAISDDGQIVLAADSVRQAGPVWIGADGDVHEIPLPPPSAVAFRARSHDAVFVSSADDRNWLATEITGETKYLALPAFGAASAAAAVAFSDGGKRFIVANTDGSLAIYDLRGGIPETISCGCALAGVQPLRGDSVFLLNDAGGDARFLLDAGRAKPRIFFILPDGGDR
jgi:WD40 repeat protein